MLKFLLYFYGGELIMTIIALCASRTIRSEEKLEEERREKVDEVIEKLHQLNNQVHDSIKPNIEKPSLKDYEKKLKDPLHGLIAIPEDVEIVPVDDHSGYLIKIRR